MKHLIEQVIAAMIAYDAGDPMRIHHFLKVHAFARFIGLSESLDAHTQSILEVAALVHDIGIHPAEAKYGSSAGKYQEELGPAEAKTLLTNLGWPEEDIHRSIFLVGHHHTYTAIDSIDHQILVEADFLVNLYEDSLPPEAQRHTYETIFKTKSGKRLCRELYPACQ